MRPVTGVRPLQCTVEKCTTTQNSLTKRYRAKRFYVVSKYAFYAVDRYTTLCLLIQVWKL